MRRQSVYDVTNIVANTANVPGISIVQIDYRAFVGFRERGDAFVTQPAINSFASITPIVRKRRTGCLRLFSRLGVIEF